MKPLEKQPGLSEMLSAKTKTGPSDGDLAVVERLVNDGKLMRSRPAERANLVALL